MGELEDEIAAGPAQTEPATPQHESSGTAAGAPPAEEPESTVDPIAAIQASLLFEESEPVVAEDMTSAEPVAAEQMAPAEPVAAVEPDADPTTADIESAEIEPVAEQDPEAEPALSEDTEAAPTDLESPEAETPPAEPGDESTSDAETTDDDLAAAIAASNEQVGTDATLDDIAPGTTHFADDEEIVSDSAARYGAPWWPFLIYLAVWFVLAGVAVWQFQLMPQGTVLYETQEYMLFVFGGLVLAAAGIILILAVWLGARVNPKRHRAGLFTSAFIKGASFILIGMVVWWGTFMALDYLRLGRLI